MSYELPFYGFWFLFLESRVVENYEIILRWISLYLYFELLSLLYSAFILFYSESLMLLYGEVWLTQWLYLFVSSSHL